MNNLIQQANVTGLFLCLYVTTIEILPGYHNTDVLKGFTAAFVSNLVIQKGVATRTHCRVGVSIQYIIFARLCTSVFVLNQVMSKLFTIQYAQCEDITF